MDAKPRILHLEDVPDWTDAISELLSEKYEVVSAPSLTAAHELLRTEDYDLALVDVSLVPQAGNDTGGFQFISFIRSSDLWRDLPVIVLTGYDSMERMRSAFKEFKVFDFIAKSELEPQEFEETIAQAIAAGPRGCYFSESPRVLVVEDNPDWQSEIKQILEEEGCQVDVASTYSEAIDRLTSQVYRLATVDIRLSDLDSTDVRGVELIDMIRRLRDSVDIIFISAYGTPAQIQKAAFDFGARDFIDKGDFRPQHLRRRVRSILSRLIYISVTVDTGAETPVLKLGNEHTLTISVSRARPQQGFSRSLTRPVTVGQFRLEVTVPPYDLDVLPGSTQELTVMSDDTAEPLDFKIVPTVEGNIELIVEVRYRDDMLTRIVESVEVIQ
jgi:CheY-like chemotaxis protein